MDRRVSLAGLNLARHAMLRWLVEAIAIHGLLLRTAYGSCIQSA